ncbi:MAG: hypothetical protein JWM31_1832 [Solirubrobacterales bacterium]|nr:hypothetical protein [Solirubrobacterales bacterium]
MIAFRSSLIRGAVSSDAWETHGFAPTISSRSTWSRSGIGTTAGEPYSSALAAKRLETSCEEAV